MRDYVERHVEAVSQEADHLAITALTRALHVPLRIAYLDQSILPYPTAMGGEGAETGAAANEVVEVNFVEFEEDAAKTGEKGIEGALLYREPARIFWLCRVFLRPTFCDYRNADQLARHRLRDAQVPDIMTCELPGRHAESIIADQREVVGYIGRPRMGAACAPACNASSTHRIHSRCQFGFDQDLRFGTRASCRGSRPGARTDAFAPGPSGRPPLRAQTAFRPAGRLHVDRGGRPLTPPPRVML